MTSGRIGLHPTGRTVRRSGRAAYGGVTCESVEGETQTSGTRHLRIRISKSDEAPVDEAGESVREVARHRQATVKVAVIEPDHSTLIDTAERNSLMY